MSAPPLLAATGVDICVGSAGKRLVQGLELHLARGEMLAVLGRNGAGKTSLLTTLAGLQAPSAGQIALCGRPYAGAGRWSARAAARLRGLLPQSSSDAFPASVMETALIGRHPHLGRWSWEGAEDLRIARAALADVGLQSFEQREVQTLSGGERQRLAIATLLTQQPALYLLDEPLAHLDLAHQMAMLELWRRCAAEQQAGLIIVLHDANLALRYCQRTLLLFGDGRWRAGASGDVVCSEQLGELYGYPMRELGDASGRYLLPA